MTWAVAGGHFEVLQWLHNNGCPWDEDTCAEAAERGHLKILQWCKENGCPWNSLTCSGAAKNGHLAVLKWAFQNGCPWDKETCLKAAKNGHLEVLKWAVENGCPCDDQRRRHQLLKGKTVTHPYFRNPKPVFQKEKDRPHKTAREKQEMRFKANQWIVGEPVWAWASKSGNEKTGWYRGRIYDRTEDEDSEHLYTVEWVDYPEFEPTPGFNSGTLKHRKEEDSARFVRHIPGLF